MAHQSMISTSSVPAGTRHRICLVFRGPNYDLDHFGRRLLALSQRFEGVCIMGYKETTTRRFGNFDVVTTRWAPGAGFTIRHFLRVVHQAFKERFSKRPAQLVISADPIKGGLYGYLVSRIIGAKFAPEINGDFADQANYIDDGIGPLEAKIKRRSMIAIATFVLKRANGARLLYPTQLSFLSAELKNKVFHSTFEYVDLSSFRNLGEEKVVLFAGFPFYLKGVDVLIAAFKQLAPKYPEWRLKILGWFPDQSILDRYIAGHPQIQHHPPVKHGEMPEHVGRCGIFVLPSRTEAMGRVLVEAMAAEKPRIGSNVGGIPTVIHDGKDGLLVKPGDVADLVEKLDRLMGDASLRTTLGRAGRERMLNEFTLEKYLDRIGSFYSAVIEGR